MTLYIGTPAGEPGIHLDSGTKQQKVTLEKAETEHFGDAMDGGGI